MASKKCVVLSIGNIIGDKTPKGLVSVSCEATPRMLAFTVNVLIFNSFVIRNIKNWMSHLFPFSSNCEAQARIGKGRRKASKLKALPRAYIKVGCHTPTTTTTTTISHKFNFN